MRIALFLALSVIVSFAAEGASVSSPPAGSDEAKIKIGDTRVKVESILGDIVGMEPAEKMRTRLIFKRCSIVFESSKVVNLPVMRSGEDIAKEISDKKKADQERAAAAQPGSPQNLKRCQEKVSALLLRFETVVSRPGAPFIYLHKAFPTQKYGLMPSVLVDDQGSLALATAYYGGAWLFHDSAGVRIANDNFQSTILPHGGPQRRVVQAGFIEERCVFSAEADHQLVRDIAFARGKRVFISLMKGGGSVLGALTEQQFASFPPIVELSVADMSAVKDSVDLADAFVALNSAKKSRDDASKSSESSRKAVEKGL